MKTRSLLTALALTAGALLTTAGTASAATTTSDGEVTPYIVGGRNATQVYSFMASLQNTRGGHFCGGALIKSNWVVTAKHCVNGKNPSSIQVRIGTTNRSSGGSVSRAAQIVTHRSGDIALVRLASSVGQTPASIASSSGPAGTRTRIIGWGATCPSGNCGGPQNLQELDTSIVPDSRCGFNRSSEICTDNPDGHRGACYGDSGGPQIKAVSGGWQLIGATSRGPATCGTGPSVYSDVPHHRSWISQYAGSV